MSLLFTNEEAEFLGIVHLSYSAIRSYLTNRSEFKKRYIDANYSTDTNMAMLIGNALHEAFARYYLYEMTGIDNEGLDMMEKAIELCPELKGTLTIKDFPFNKERVLNIAKKIIDDLIIKNNILIKGYSPDKSEEMHEDAYKNIEIAVNGYFDNLPYFRQIKGVEIMDKVLISYNGFQYPIALKAIIDLIYFDEEGRLCIWDHKFVAKMEDSDQIKADFDFQAGACYFVALSLFGVVPYSMTYNQISKSIVNPFKGLLKDDLIAMCMKNGLEVDMKANKEGIRTCSNKVEELKQMIIDAGIVDEGKQVVPYTIIYEEKPYIIEMFMQTFENILNEIWLITNNDLKFLPNVFDMMTGKSSYQEYVLETTGYDLAKTDIDLDLELNL